MGMGASLVMAVCGGSGNDTLAFIVVIFVAAIYVLSLLTAFGKAEDGQEMVMLIALLSVSIAVGGLAFLYPNGTSGNGDYFSRFIISLVISGGLGLGAAAIWKESSAGRAIFVALAGDVLIPGGLLLLLFASIGIGSGCIA
jgi:hypothetical protein